MTTAKRSGTFRFATATVAAALLLGACAHQAPDRVEADFRKTNKLLTVGQTYNHAAAQRPRSAPPTGLDGALASEVHSAYRADTANRQGVGRGLPTLGVLSRTAR